MSGHGARAVAMLGPTALLVAAHDGLDQERLRNVLTRVMPGVLNRRIPLAKQDLATQVVKLALGNPAVLKGLARELDRASKREITLVASLEPDALRARVLALPQLGLRRERARVLWALAVHGSEAAAAVAREMAQAIERAVGDARDQIRPDVSPQQMRQTVMDMAQEAQTAERRAEAVEQRLERLENDRATLMAQLGAAQARGREEVERRATSERVASRMVARQRELEEQLADTRAQLARQQDEHRAHAVDQSMVVRLHHLQGRLYRSEAERDALAERVKALEAEDARRREEHRALAGSLVVRETVAQQRIKRLRESLREVRRQRARAQDDTDEATQDLVKDERVALHVDVANLAAGAKRYHQARMDFTQLPLALASGRRLVRAVAYAVEQGEPAKFSAFCAALRRSGFEVKVKKPRHRSDGTVKADWDMGMAMDIVEDTDHVDTIILCSGDGDFTPLLQLMRRRGKRVEVAAFKPDAHEELRMAAHAFYALGGEHTLV